jgi:hypothetical protein
MAIIRRFLWMVAIWMASVAVMGAVAVGIRFLVRG